MVGGSNKIGIRMIQPTRTGTIVCINHVSLEFSIRFWACPEGLIPPALNSLSPKFLDTPQLLDKCLRGYGAWEEIHKSTTSQCENVRNLFDTVSVLAPCRLQIWIQPRVLIPISLIWLWINTYEHTIFRGMNIHFNPAILMWTTGGTRVLTHPHMI